MKTKTSASKSAQWTAIIILALMVGGLTFVMVYLGGDKPPTVVDDLYLPILTFASKKYPVDTPELVGIPAQATEVNQYGYQDYWYENRTGQNLTVGLNDKGCKCSEVAIAVLPESIRQRFVNEAALRLLQRSMLDLNNLPTLAASYQYKRMFPEIAEGEVPLTTLDGENTVEVPDKALGFVRLSWRRDQAIPLRTHAGLWMVRRGSNANAKLDVEVKITEPMEFHKEITVRPLDFRDLNKGKTAIIACWSVTRPRFNVKAQLLREHLSADSDPIEVGEPIPLTAKEMQTMERDWKEVNQLRVLSGYRIPVTIKAKAKDGTPIEWGHFRRIVQLSSPDAGIDPVQVKVNGEVRGDVSILGGSGESGGITLGPFPRSRGTHGEVILQSEEKNLQLELDTSRKPRFINVDFTEAPATPGSSVRQWKLRVDVPPGKANGQFPRDDDPVYRDSAIYVKTKAKENPPHTIRVPVFGTANDG